MAQVGTPTRTLVFDVSDLDEPEFFGTHAHATVSTDHNLYVRGRYVYEANYTSGLCILDAQPLRNGTGLLEDAAFFDTYPDGDGAELLGAWSVYPFFESGVLLVSDKTYGLFTLRATGLATVSEEAPAFVEGRNGMTRARYHTSSSRVTVPGTWIWHPAATSV